MRASAVPAVSYQRLTPRPRKWSNPLLHLGVIAFGVMAAGLLSADEPPVPEQAPERAASVIVCSAADEKGRTVAGAKPGAKVRGNVGSGTIIGRLNGQFAVLTCSHVLLPRGRHWVKVAGQKYPARLVARDVRNDLALLTIQTKRDLPWAPLGIRAPGPRTSVHAGGFPGGRDFRAQVAVVTGFHGKNLLLRYVNRAGESGGGVFYRGQLVGVMWGHETARRTTLATRVEQVRAFLRVQGIRLERGAAAPRSRLLAAVLDPRSDEPRPGLLE